MNRQQYVRAVLTLYGGLPHRAVRRPSPYDRRIAAELFERQIPLAHLQTAFYLVIARRTLLRQPQAIPLQPIRSLAYFLPVIDEILSQSVDPDYLLYLRKRLDLEVQIPTDLEER